MRLVCPNCEAKYEVPEDAIPETGRDVQCANCGHAWYQMRPRAPVAEAVSAAPVVAAPVAKAPEPAPVPEPMPEPVPEAEVVSAPAPEPAPEPQPEPEVAPIAPAPDVVAEAAAPEASAPSTEPVPEPVVEPVVEAAPEPVPVVEAATEPAETVAAAAEAAASEVPPEAGPAPAAPATTDDEDDTPSAIPDTAGAAAAVAAAAAPAAYAVDDSVLAILREEAERESQARKAESAGPLEVQADLGIDAAAPVSKRPVEVISADESPSPADDGDDKHGARRARLPDVEEINSTLRPSEQVADETSGEAVAAEEGRSGFRSGFLLVMTIAILASALYISADALTEAIPALAGFLKAYVGLVDSLRLQLDGLMQSATVAINGSGA